MHNPSSGSARFISSGVANTNCGGLGVAARLTLPMGGSSVRSGLPLPEGHAMASFTTAPLTERTGAEVVGLDFTAPIDREDRAVLQRAFVEHHVLVMRGQNFRPDQFKAAVELFGEIQLHDKKERHVPG